MAKKKRKNKNKKKTTSMAPSAHGTNGAPQDPAAEGGRATVPSAAAAPLGAPRGLRARPKKASAKEQAAIAKKEARAKWDARMTAEGR